MGKDTPRGEDTHAGGVAPVCGGADRGRRARRSAALVSEFISEGAFPTHGILNNGENEKQQVCAPLCAACCFCADFAVCTKLCPFLCFGCGE